MSDATKQVTVVSYRRADGSPGSQVWSSEHSAQATLRQIARNGWSLVSVETLKLESPNV